MQIFSGESKAKANHPDFSTMDKPQVVDLVDVLTKVFFLNQEERFRAGIYVGNEGREWIDQAALVIPPYDEEQISPINELIFPFET